MEISVSSIALAIVVVTLLTWTLKMVNWVWLRPKKLERSLRRQGLRGNPYRFLYGDLKEASLMREEANSRPISLSHDIAPRIAPFPYHNIQKYGKDSFMWFGPIPRLNIMDPEQIKEVFLKFSDFRKLSSNPFVRFILNGLVILEDEKWARHRKIMNPAFHAEKLKLMLPAFDLSCNMMVNEWKNLTSKGGSCELDVWPYLQNVTGDVISRTAFGNSYDEARMIFELQTEQAQLVLKAVQTPYIPGWRFVPTKLNRRMKEINDTTQSLLKSIISEREKAMKAGEAANDDLLGILLESNMNEIRGLGMSNADVIEECKLFYLAGQETTSSLLVWTMVLLSQHPTWQDQARAEVLQVFGENKPDYEGLNHLKIVTMILNEVLRLYPPGIMITRTVHRETKLGSLPLPAGVQVTIPTVLVHRDRELWGDDAEEFKPERFAEGVSKATGNRLSFFPFIWGPRICIGQNFAMMEAKLALTIILHNFWFELSPSYVHAPFTIITLQPQHGCHLVLHKR